jgi:L-asparaginase/Glu-tRNA(Gln) amidotransferase subunit D
MYGTGSGLVTPVFLDSIREARRRGIVVVAVTQCLHGGVSLDTVSLWSQYCDRSLESSI